MLIFRQNVYLQDAVGSAHPVCRSETSMSIDPIAYLSGVYPLTRVYPLTTRSVHGVSTMKASRLIAGLELSAHLPQHEKEATTGTPKTTVRCS